MIIGRRDFLTGFRKRKNARRKKAQEDNQRKEEEKRKQLREEVHTWCIFVKDGFCLMCRIFPDRLTLILP